MDEYIERKSAIEAVHHAWAKNLNPQQYIDIIPAADVAPVRHGRWVMRGGKRYCSECGNRACVTRDSDDFWYTVGTDFCPHCGARMDLEEPNETKET